MHHFTCKDQLIGLKLSGMLSARQACILAFWATKGGLVNEVLNKIAVRPTAQSGYFSQVFDRVLGTKPSDTEVYEVNVGLRLRHDASRRFDPVPIIPPHEVLAKEMAVSDEAEREFRAAVANNELPPLYWEHPAVRAAPAGAMVHPIAFYVDAVPFGRQESVLGFWCQLLLSQERHLIAVLRKSELCNCGCKGWCSYAPIWEALAWSTKALHAARYPSSRHDGQPWRPTDQGRAALTGSSLGFSSCVLFLKGDWSEFANTVGFPNWSDQISPCPFCFADRHTWFDCEQLTALTPSHMPKDARSYEDACARCEIPLELDAAAIDRLRGRLVYVKTKKAQGRYLSSPLPEYGLLQYDRLEPSRELLDIAAIDGPSASSARAVFWRQSSETSARHRNPLFSHETGLSPVNLGIDWLHTLSLGVFQFWLAVLCWDLIDANAWDVAGRENARINLSISILRAELFSWYGREAAAGRAHTQVQKLTPGMFGDHDSPECRLHGAETNGFLAFSEFLLQTRGDSLPPGRRNSHARAGRTLRQILQKIRAYKRAMPPAAVEEFILDIHGHMSAVHDLAIRLKPKHHLLIELGNRPT